MSVSANFSSFKPTIAKSAKCQPKGTVLRTVLSAYPEDKVVRKIDSIEVGYRELCHIEVMTKQEH